MDNTNLDHKIGRVSRTLEELSLQGKEDCPGLRPPGIGGVVSFSSAEDVEDSPMDSTAVARSNNSPLPLGAAINEEELREALDTALKILDSDEEEGVKQDGGKDGAAEDICEGPFDIVDFPNADAIRVFPQAQAGQPASLRLLIDLDLKQIADSFAFERRVGMNHIFPGVGPPMMEPMLDLPPMQRDLLGVSEADIESYLPARVLSIALVGYTVERCREMMGYATMRHFLATWLADHDEMESLVGGHVALIFASSKLRLPISFTYEGLIPGMYSFLLRFCSGDNVAVNAFARLRDNHELGPAMSARVRNMAIGRNGPKMVRSMAAGRTSGSRGSSRNEKAHSARRGQVSQNIGAGSRTGRGGPRTRSQARFNRRL